MLSETVRCTQQGVRKCSPLAAGDAGLRGGMPTGLVTTPTGGGVRGRDSDDADGVAGGVVPRETTTAAAAAAASPSADSVSASVACTNPSKATRSRKRFVSLGDQ
jgi:hypothetical protein